MLTCYYDIIDPTGKRVHSQFLTEKMVESMRSRGYKLRLTKCKGEFV